MKVLTKILSRKKNQTQTCTCINSGRFVFKILNLYLLSLNIVHTVRMQRICGQIQKGQKYKFKKIKILMFKKLVYKNLPKNIMSLHYVKIQIIITKIEMFLQFVYILLIFFKKE